MFWQVLKKTGIDIWDEMLYLIVFNVVWVFGTLLVIPLPFVTFALFRIAKDMGEARGIKFTAFFQYGKESLKPAYIWGGINLAVLVGLWLNFVFYGNFNAQWANLLQLLMISLTFFWLILQLLTLAIYPRLAEPSFKLALRNASVVMGRYPFMVLGMVACIIAFTIFTFLFTAMIFLVTFSFTALLVNNVVDAILSQEMDRKEELQG